MMNPFDRRKRFDPVDMEDLTAEIDRMHKCIEEDRPNQSFYRRRLSELSDLFGHTVINLIKGE